MTDPSKTNTEPIEENALLKQRIPELEQAMSERLRIEEAFKDSELKYRSLIEHSSDVVFCVDKNGEYKFVNQVFASTFSKTADYFLGKTFWDIYPKEHADHRQATSIKVFETGESQSVEVVVPLPDRTMYFIAKANPVRDETGKVVLNLTHATDITERKQVEDALRQEYSFRNAIIANVAEGLCVCHETTYYPFNKFTIWNDRMTEITGYTVEEINRLGWYQTVYPDPELQAKAIERMKRMRQSKDLRGEEWEITRADGNKRVLNISTSVVESDDGVVHVLAFMQDITERKRAQEALRVSETHYRLLAENARDVIWTVDMDMRLTYVSPSVTRLLGFTEEEAMARTMQQAFTPEVFEKTMQIFAEEMAIESEGHGDPARSRMLELDLVRKDGNTVTVEGNFCFLRDPTGKVIGMLSILRDITDRKRAEESLRDSENRYRELSIIDDLTQLYNSRHFYHQLTIEIDRADRYKQPLTLLLLDLDDFKAFNDAYGHIEGDQVLLRLGQVVKRQLRQIDSAYRYGGEEFTILLPMTTNVDGAVTAERIRTEFKKEYFSPVPSQDVHVTLSIGLAQYKPKEDMKALVHRVDQLMYQGKKNGKDRVCSEP
jgi:diguanylate cyclase (GGDEF)-like protein/PAS domain S-box-containing protein